MNRAEKHGYWKYVRNVKLSGTIKLCECSVCHNKIFGGLNYCGNCGAKMDSDRMSEYSKNEILKHLDSLMICVGNAYNTSHYLLESDMKFIEKQEKIIKELLEGTRNE